MYWLMCGIALHSATRHYGSIGVTGQASGRSDLVAVDVIRQKKGLS